MVADELPSAGDVAQVVRTCECVGGREHLDLVVMVQAIGPASVAHCTYCLRVYETAERADVCTATLAGTYPRTWLRRYRTLSELDSIDVDVEQGRRELEEMSS